MLMQHNAFCVSSHRKGSLCGYAQPNGGFHATGSLCLQSCSRWAGLSPAAGRGVVAAHFAAAEVSLRQCSKQLRHPAQFQALWAALAAGSAARRMGVPVSAVDAKNCGWIQDEDVIELCAALPKLRCASQQQAAA